MTFKQLLDAKNLFITSSIVIGILLVAFFSIFIFAYLARKKQDRLGDNYDNDSVDFYESEHRKYHNKYSGNGKK